MRPGTNKRRSTNTPSSNSPSSTPMDPVRSKERELFARMAKVKQYPISPDEEPTPSPQKS